MFLSYPPHIFSVIFHTLFPRAISFHNSEFISSRWGFSSNKCHLSPILIITKKERKKKTNL